MSPDLKVWGPVISKVILEKTGATPESIAGLEKEAKEATAKKDWEKVSQLSPKLANLSTLKDDLDSVIKDFANFIERHGLSNMNIPFPAISEAEERQESKGVKLELASALKELHQTLESYIVDYKDPHLNHKRLEKDWREDHERHTKTHGENSLFWYLPGKIEGKSPTRLTRITNTLLREGISKNDDLAEVDASNLIDIRNLGEGSLPLVLAMRKVAIAAGHPRKTITEQEKTA